jgi:hypothetical protein
MENFSIDMLRLSAGGRRHSIPIHVPELQACEGMGAKMKSQITSKNKMERVFFSKFKISALS